MYFNEEQVGHAIHEKIADGVIRREDIFVTTKLAPMAWHQVKESLIKSLKRLQLDYIDLFLIHDPMVVNCPIGGIDSIADYRTFVQNSKDLPPGKFHI